VCTSKHEAKYCFGLLLSSVELPLYVAVALLVEAGAQLSYRSVSLSLGDAPLVGATSRPSRVAFLRWLGYRRALLSLSKRARAGD